MGAKKAGKKKNIVLRVILGILIALILIVGIYFLYVFRTYHRIEDKQDLDVTKGSATEACAVGKEYNVISYNIGFGAYTPDFSFFMDGGKSSWAKSKESVNETVTGAAELVRNRDVPGDRHGRDEKLSCRSEEAHRRDPSRVYECLRCEL